MARTQSPQYNSPLKQEADARRNRLVQARQQQLAANVLKGIEAAETTPGYTADPMTGLLVSDRTIAEMSGKDKQENPEILPINHERLNQAIVGAVSGYNYLHGIDDNTPNTEDIDKALTPAAKAHLDGLLETFGDDGRMVLSKPMTVEEMKKFGVTYVGDNAKNILQENRENRGSDWRLSVINTKVELNTTHNLSEEVTDSGLGHPRIDALVEIALEAKKGANANNSSKQNQLLGNNSYKWFWASETNTNGSRALYVDVGSVGYVGVYDRDVRSAYDVGGVLVSGAEDLGFGTSKNL